MGRKPIRTPVAGLDEIPLQALPLIKRAIAKFDVTSASAVDHVLNKDTTCVRVLVDGAVYWGETEAVTSASEKLTPGSGTAAYDTRGVTPGATLSFRAVTGSVAVQVLEF